MRINVSASDGAPIYLQIVQQVKYQEAGSMVLHLTPL